MEGGGRAEISRRSSVYHVQSRSAQGMLAFALHTFNRFFFRLTVIFFLPCSRTNVGNHAKLDPTVL